MPRYYFHVHNDHHRLDDPAGEAHKTIDAAIAKAGQIARELAQEPATYRGYNVVVTDGTGKTVAIIPITTG